MPKRTRTPPRKKDYKAIRRMRYSDSGLKQAQIYLDDETLDVLKQIRSKFRFSGGKKNTSVADTRIITYAIHYLARKQFNINKETFNVLDTQNELFAFTASLQFRSLQSIEKILTGYQVIAILIKNKIIKPSRDLVLFLDRKNPLNISKDEKIKISKRAAAVFSSYKKTSEFISSYHA